MSPTNPQSPPSIIRLVVCVKALKLVGVLFGVGYRRDDKVHVCYLKTKGSAMIDGDKTTQMSNLFMFKLMQYFLVIMMAFKRNYEAGVNHHLIPDDLTLCANNVCMYYHS